MLSGVTTIRPGAAETYSMANHETPVAQPYALARERYAEFGVDTEAALSRLATIPVSLHCWQGDDVGGFENLGAELGGGLAGTGNYPGKAHTPAELRADLGQRPSLNPRTHPPTPQAS